MFLLLSCPLNTALFLKKSVKAFNEGLTTHFNKKSDCERKKQRLYPSLTFGASPSGKATDFDSVIRRFDPSRPNHYQVRSRLKKSKTHSILCVLVDFNLHYLPKKFVEIHVQAGVTLRVSPDDGLELP